MSRNESLIEIGQQLAEDTFYATCQQCKTEDELMGLVTMLCTLSAKVIAGMEGMEFKEGFLKGAIADDEAIKPVLSQ